MLDMGHHMLLRVFFHRNNKGGRKITVSPDLSSNGQMGVCRKMSLKDSPQILGPYECYVAMKSLGY